MIRDSLKKYFSDRGFNRVTLNASGMDLYYLDRAGIAYIVWMIDGNILTPDAYLNSMSKIKDSFVSKGLEVEGMITLFLTNDPKGAAAIASGTDFWVIDEQYGRLVIYENMPEDFCGIRLTIEKMISFFAADRLRMAAEADARRDGAGSRNAGHKRKRTMDDPWHATGNVKVFRPWFTYLLIITNVIICIVMELVISSDVQGEWIEWGASNAVLVLEDHEFYRLITSMFIHFGFDHLIGNMIVLFATGEMLEMYLGRFRFLILYFLGGILAGLGSCYYYSKFEPSSLSAGASGAIMALLGAFAYMMIAHRDRFGGDAKVRIVLFIIYILYSTVGRFSEEGVDNAAHVSGLFAGVVIYGAMNLIGNLKKKSGV